MNNKEIITYSDLYERCSKVWLTTKDIMIIGNCGRDSAIKVRKEIEQQVIDMGKKVIVAKTKVVPTQLVLDYYGLDIDYISKMANLNKTYRFGGVS